MAFFLRIALQFHSSQRSKMSEALTMCLLPHPNCYLSCCPDQCSTDCWSIVETTIASGPVRSGDYSTIVQDVGVPEWCNSIFSASWQKNRQVWLQATVRTVITLDSDLTSAGELSHKFPPQFNWLQPGSCGRRQSPKFQLLNLCKTDHHKSAAAYQILQLYL